jgi:argonaute-like protein implicated in RNA metabolism and viral defense
MIEVDKNEIDINKLTKAEFKALEIANRIVLKLSPSIPFISRNVKEMEDNIMAFDINIKNFGGFVGLVKTIAECL